MIDGMSIIFAYILVIAVGIVFIAFFVYITKVMLCHKKYPTPPSKVKEEEKFRQTEMTKSKDSSQRSTSSTISALHDLGDEIDRARIESVEIS